MAMAMMAFGTNTASDSSCFCSANTGWSAMQTHFFIHKRLSQPGFDLALCHTRWLSHSTAANEPALSMTSQLHIRRDATTRQGHFGLVRQTF